MTARPIVELVIPPYKGELDSWGNDSRGQWWGLVTWYEDVVLPKQMGRSSVLPCALLRCSSGLTPGHSSCDRRTAPLLRTSWLSLPA
jgi:hypothetical protein